MKSPCWLKVLITGEMFSPEHETTIALLYFKAYHETLTVG
jgi:hypothetical protein